MSKLPTIKQLSQLVGNPAAYAVQRDDGNGYYPVRSHLDNYVLKQHLAGEMTVGTYINTGNVARTLIFDIDELDLQPAKRIVDSLIELGVPLRSTGIEFSGSKGYHVWVVMATYVSASDLRRVGRAVTALAEVDCEVFPKQDEVRDLGNLVKLPGGVHHKTGKRAEMLTPWPIPMGAGVLKRVLDKLPEDVVRSHGGGPAPTLECLAAIQEGPEEGWRNHGLFHYATMLYRSSLNADNVRLLVEQANAKCEPEPLDSEEIDQLLLSAAHSGPICDTIPKHIQCAECPVRRRKGLYCKPGQIRHGAEGELVVVQLGERRKSGEVELIHPDLDFGLVSPANVPPKGNK